MDERDGAISEDFGNKLSPCAYDDDQPCSYDDDQQSSLDDSPLDSMENNGNGFHEYAPDGQSIDTTDSMPFFSGLSKITR